MPGERDKILQKLGRVLGAGDNRLPPTQVSGRLEHPHVGPRPKLPGTPLPVFVDRLKAAAATVSQVRSPADATQAIIQYLDDRALPHELVSDLSALVSELPWPDNLVVRPPPPRAEDRVAVTSAYAAIAETGSLALLSSAQSPTSLNYLPDHYICLLSASRILPYLEDLWATMRRESRAVPRAVNLITGPSRTADVEQTIQLGAHGPRSVHVVVLGESPTPA